MLLTTVSSEKIVFGKATNNGNSCWCIRFLRHRYSDPAVRILPTGKRWLRPKREGGEPRPPRHHTGLAQRSLDQGGTCGTTKRRGLVEPRPALWRQT